MNGLAIQDQGKQRAIGYWFLTLGLILGYLAIQDVHWHSTAHFHTLLETIATLLAFIVGVVALVRYRSRPTNAFLFIGAGLLGTAFLDGYHTIVTSPWLTTLATSLPSSLIPWSWVASRIFLAVMLYVGFLMTKREKRLGERGRVDARVVAIGAVFFCLFCFLFFSLVPLPNAYMPNWYPALRPQELIAAFFFLLTLVGYLRDGQWRIQALEHWMVLALIVSVVGQAVFMPSSQDVFDLEFDLAHFLKKVSYICVLTGLLFNMLLLYRRADLTPLLISEIAERKRTEAKLLESRRLVEEAQSIAHMGNWVLDPITLKSEWSDEMFHIMGVEKSEQTGIELLSHLLHPEDRDTVLASLDTALQSNQHHHIEYRIVRPDGGIRWLECEGMRITDDSGTLVELRGVVQDITQRKYAQQAVEEHGQQVSDLLDSTAEAIIGTDLHRRCTFVNKSGLEMLGYSDAEQLIGHNIHQLIHHTKSDGTPYPEEECPMVQTVQEGVGVYRNDEIIWRADGTSFQLEYWSYPVRRQGNLVGSVVAFLDITERKQMEQQLSKLAQVAEQNPNTIVITDLQPKIEYVNEAFVKSTGYSREEAVGQNPSILKSGKSPKGTYASLWETLKRGESWKGEFINRRKDGTHYDESALITPLRQEDGTITHYVAVKLDISETKRLNEELEVHRHHLKELVQSRTTELAEARERAEAANRTKSAFLANMSHEIRTPMNAIIGLTHLLQCGNPTTEQSKQLTKIDMSASHLLSIINDILDISKIEAGKLSLEQSDFHLNAIFDHIQSLLREQAIEKGIVIRVEPGHVPVWLHGDPTRLRQALLNYASNAIKFTERGSVELRARIEENKGSELLVRFEVQDTGIGIDADKLSRLFQAFEQADASTTRKYGGSGLGLVITQRLAELMGGKVGVVSEPGKGSTFWFTARLARGVGVERIIDPSEHNDVEEELCSGYAGSRILLVEDNDINQEVAISLLSRTGMIVDSAENGRVAVNKARTKPYDLILMDIHMPEMDGMEATRMIRAMPGNEELPILAFTANVFSEDRQACLDVGMNDFVSKPVDPKTLFTTLMKWLPKREDLTDVRSSIAHDHAAADDTVLIEQLSAIEGLDAQTGLRNMRGDAVGYLRLLRQLDAAHGEDMHKLGEYLEAGKINEALCLAHTLKGAAGTLGLTALQEVARALEDYLRNQNEAGEETPNLIEAVNTEQNHLHEVLARIAPETVPRQSINVDPAKTQEVLNHLRALLAKDNTAANELFSETEIILRQTYGTVVGQLGKQIAAFDYSAAVATVDSISDSLTNAGQPNSPIDPQALTKIFGDDIARHLDIYSKFISQSESTMAEVKVAFETHDAEWMHFHTHKLKSSARLVGANDLADLCQAMEIAGGDANLDEIERLYPRLIPVMERVTDYINGL